MRSAKPTSTSRRPRLLLATAGALALCAVGAAPSQSCGSLAGGGGGAGAGGIPPVCGDGVVSGIEECDGTNVRGQTCTTYGRNPGWVSGTLRCDPETCTMDTRDCKRPVCGDGRIEGDETCDGNLGVGSCAAGEIGSVTCDPTFCTLNTSGCKPATCGNGRIEGDEECDGQDLGGATCQSVRQTVDATGPLRCYPNCKYDLRACVPSLGTCGNGIIEAQEHCEGQATCQEYAVSVGLPADYYKPGMAYCDPVSCRIDSIGTRYCERNRSHCGNGIVERQYGETCDGTNLDGASCLSAGFLFGVPRCSQTCEISYFAGCFGACVSTVRAAYCQ